MARMRQKPAVGILVIVSDLSVATSSCVCVRAPLLASPRCGRAIASRSPSGIGCVSQARNEGRPAVLRCALSGMVCHFYPCFIFAQCFSLGTSSLIPGATRRNRFQQRVDELEAEARAKDDGASEPSSASEPSDEPLVQTVLLAHSMGSVFQFQKGVSSLCHRLLLKRLKRYF